MAQSKKKLTHENTVPVKVAGVPLRAETEKVQAYNEAVDKVRQALNRLWQTIRGKHAA